MHIIVLEHHKITLCPHRSFSSNTQEIQPSCKYQTLLSSLLFIIQFSQPLQNFLPKLKAHLLPHIKALLHQNAVAHDDGMPSTITDPTEHADHDRIFFQLDRMYKHALLRVNYTTYDVRRAQDVINPNTHC
jgi:hypothetical protein